jgi:hypothetical protein
MDASTATGDAAADSSIGTGVLSCNHPVVVTVSQCGGRPHESGAPSLMRRISAA